MSAVAVKAVGSVKEFFRRSGRNTVEFVKQLKNDYVTVAKDTVTACKEKPLRTGIIFSGLGFLTYAYRTNPTALDLKNTLCEKRQMMVLVPQSEHNPETVRELSRRNLSETQNRLQHYDFWFFSLLLSEKFDENLKIYSSQDSNLKKWYLLEFYENIIDIGFLGNWYTLNQKFVDYDVNTDEIKNLPE